MRDTRKKKKQDQTAPNQKNKNETPTKEHHEVNSKNIKIIFQNNM